MDRRNFLRGTLLTGTAGLIAPGIASLIGEERAESATLAIVTPEEMSDEIAAMNSSQLQRLIARINAHFEMFGEPPKALFVNRYEMRAVIQDIAPLARFRATSDYLAERGYNNILVKGVPVICLEADALVSDPKAVLR